ncbi:MAG: DUF1499 domain-containing protein [Cyclobacteriaceae bacterium]|jgi:hypothetical protein|nr:DUF1499 domain-containing protein [Cyclobacteriaceae bacterium]
MKQSTFNKPNNTVIAAIKKAAKQMDLELEEVSGNEITLYHGGGLLSFGNKITVKISESEPNKTKVIVSSRSAAEIQLIDWGTNEKLENDLIKELKNILLK